MKKLLRCFTIALIFEIYSLQKAETDHEHIKIDN